MRKLTKKQIAEQAAIVTAAAPALLSMNMSTEAVLGETGDPALDALMAELNGVGMPSDEILLPNEPEGAEFETNIEAAGDAEDDLLATAVSGAEMLEAYEQNADAPASTDAAAPKAAAEKPAKEKKAKAPKAPKPAKKFYGLDKLTRLTDRGVAAVMLKAEEALTGDDLKAAQDRTMEVVAKSNQKVKNRTSNILEFVTGKTAVLNNLIRVCFTVLEKDGTLVTGEKGNMWATLSTCYGAGTIRSGGNNSVAALRELQVILATPAGYVKNPDSALYERIKERLAGAVEAEAETPAEEPAEPAIESAEGVEAEVETAVEETPAEAPAEMSSETADAVA